MEKVAYVPQLMSSSAGDFFVKNSLSEPNSDISK